MNILNKKLAFILVLLQLTFISTLSAQWNFAISTQQEFNSNPFRAVQSDSVNSLSDFVSSYNFGIEKEFDAFNILYYGNYTGFKTAKEINYYWHQVGLYNETESFIWGLYLEQRINNEENNFFDYLNYAGYIRKSFRTGTINWKANLSFSAMEYSEIPDFNNWVASARLTANKSFATRTTFIGTLIFNYKGFKNFTSETDIRHGVENTYYIEENVNISQIEFNGRIAQSIMEGTGLALNFNYKNILSGSGFSASLIESTYGDMELYDDPVSQEGYSAGGMLTQMLPSDIIFRISYYYYDKSYPSQGIYLSETEYDEIEARADEQAKFSTSISKSFIVNEDTGSELDLMLNYYIINNISNSYYFNYDMNAISLSLTYIF